MNNPTIIKIRIHYPDGSFSQISNIAKHPAGFLCKWREEGNGSARTNWSKQDDVFVLAVEAEELVQVFEPMFCPGKVRAAGLCHSELQNRLDECRNQKDFRSILDDATLQPLFFTLGDNGEGYRVEVI